MPNRTDTTETDSYAELIGRLLVLKGMTEEYYVVEVAAIAPDVGVTLAFVNTVYGSVQKKGEWAYCLNGPLSPLTAKVYKNGRLTQEGFNTKMQAILAGIEAGYFCPNESSFGFLANNPCPFNQ
jgi:hypothetical protein